MTKRLLLFVFALTLLAGLTLAPSTPAPVTVEAQEGYTPAWEDAECPFFVPEDQTVDCGYLIVPESRSNPGGPQLRLAVGIIRAEGDALPDPIVYLEGGPGGSALYGIDAWYNTRFGENRDIILIDQ